MKLHILNSSSAANGYILEASREALVLECGCPLISVKEALRFDLSKVKGVSVSHLHGDHSKYIPQFAKAGIRVYTHSDVIEHTKGVGEWCFNQIESGKQFSVGEFKIIPFEVAHDVPCMGFLLNHPESGTILFATDTAYLPKRFKSLNHILIECNYEHRILNDNLWNGTVDSFRGERTQRTHMSLDTCIESLKANDLKAVQNIVLIHLSPQNSDADMFREKVIEATGKAVHVAKKGLVIDFNKNPY